VAKAIQAYFPEPNLAGLGNNFNNATPQVPKNPFYNGKVDYALSPSNQISSSLQIFFSTTQWQSSWGKQPICYGSERCGNQIVNSQQWAVSDRWTLSPTAINEARINFVRQHYNTFAPSGGQNFPSKLGLNNVPPDYFPTITISGVVPTSLSPGKIGGGTQNTFAYSDNFTWVKGRHTVKLGGGAQQIPIQHSCYLEFRVVRLLGTLYWTGLRGFPFGASKLVLTYCCSHYIWS